MGLESTRAACRPIVTVKVPRATVCFAALFLTLRATALGRLPMLALPRWPAAMQLIPDFAASMTAVQGEAATGLHLLAGGPRPEADRDRWLLSGQTLHLVAITRSLRVSSEVG